MDDAKISFSSEEIGHAPSSLNEYLAQDIEEAYEDCERYESNLRILEENVY